MEMKEKKEMNGDAEKPAADTVSHEKVGLKQEVNAFVEEFFFFLNLFFVL